MSKNNSNKYQPLPVPDENKSDSSMPHGSYDRAVLSWIAPEYLEHKRGPIFYLISGIIIILLLIYASYTNGWSMVILSITIIGIYILFTFQKPKLIEIKISDLGIKVGQKIYPFSHLNAFWIIYHPPRVKTLNLRTTNKLVGDLTVQLGNQDPALVRNFLLTQVRELENKQETLADIISHLLRI